MNTVTLSNARHCKQPKQPLSTVLVQLLGSYKPIASIRQPKQPNEARTSLLLGSLHQPPATDSTQPSTRASHRQGSAQSKPGPRLIYRGPIPGASDPLRVDTGVPHPAHGYRNRGAKQAIASVTHRRHMLRSPLPRVPAPHSFRRMPRRRSRRRCHACIRLRPAGAGTSGGAATRAV